MFIEPIEVATAALAPAPRRRSDAAKLVAGVAFLALSALLMLPWAMLMGLWFGAAATIRGVRALIRDARAILLFSGETVLGR